MIKDDKSRQQWAEETYAILQKGKDTASKKKHIRKKLETAMSNVKYTHIKVHEDFQNLFICLATLLLVLLFMNTIFTIFLWNRMLFFLKILDILGWGLIVLLKGIIILYIRKSIAVKFDLFYFVKDGYQIQINIIRQYVYLQIGERYFKISENKNEELTKEVFFTDNVLVNAVFSFNFVKRLNCCYMKEYKNVINIELSQSFGNLRCSRVNFSSVNIKLKKTDNFLYPYKFSPIFYYHGGYNFNKVIYADWQKKFKFDENDHIYGSSFKIKYEDINNENMEIKLPKWFFEQCEKNNIILPKMNFVVEEKNKDRV